MFLTKKRLVKGQTIQFLLNTGVDISSATEFGVNYLITDRKTGAVILSGKWSSLDLSPAFLVDLKKVKFTYKNVPAGKYSVFPYAVFPDTTVDKSADPTQFFVREEHEL